MEERRNIRFRLQHVWPGTLDHAPFPATASAEGAQLNVPPFPATVSAEGRLIKGGPSPLAGERLG
jgi:hypothetical protein